MIIIKTQYELSYTFQGLVLDINDGRWLGGGHLFVVHNILISFEYSYHDTTFRLAMQYISKINTHICVSYVAV